MNLQIKKHKNAIFVSCAAIAIFTAGCISFNNHTLTVKNGEKTEKITMNFWDVHKLGIPEKENYDFLNWEDEHGNSIFTVSGLLSDKTVTANFEPKEYTIRYFDGETELQTDTYTYGKTKRLQKSNINRDEHPYENFIGWVDKDGNSIQFLKEDASGDIDLYTNYMGKEYSISYELNGGSATLIDKYVFGVTTSLPQASKSGYEFTGWYTDSNLSRRIDCISPDMHENIKLYAGFKRVYLPGRVYCGNYSARIVYGGGQATVDAVDSCIYDDWYGRAYLCDHASQGFDAIKYNNTMIVNGRVYTCVVRVHGYNTGYDIVLDDGTSWDKAYPGTLIAYTCNDTSGTNVTVTYWS